MNKQDLQNIFLYTSLPWKQILIVFGVLLVIVVGWLLGRSDTPSPVVVSEEPFLNGYIGLSMAKEGNNVGLYQLDMNTPNATFEPVVSSNKITLMQQEVSKDNKWSFFVFSPNLAHDSYAGVSNIIRINNDTEDLTYVLPPDNEYTAERHLAYSDKRNMLAFSAQTPEQFESHDGITDSVEQWGVYTVDLETGKVLKIAEGIDPLWAPDASRLLFLAKDGIKSYNLETGVIADAALFDGAQRQFSDGFQTNINLALSPDGKSLVVAFPDEHALYMMDIFSWSPGPVSLTNLRTIQNDVKGIEYYWPTFSPDGKYLAVQARESADGTDTHPSPAELRIIELETDSVIGSYSLADFDFTRLFIDNWID